MSNEAKVLIVCGMPGAGKSTFAQCIGSATDSMIFESDEYLRQLYGEGGAGHDAAGDFTSEALARVYQAMLAGVRAALAAQFRGLILIVGSFRSFDQREMFRNLSSEHTVRVVTVAVECDLDMAVKRVEMRVASGGHGPTPNAMSEIATKIGDASDVDLHISNRGSLIEFRGACTRYCSELIIAIKSPDPFDELLAYFDSKAEQIVRSASTDVQDARLEAWPIDRLSEIISHVAPDVGSVFLTSLPGRRVRINCPMDQASLIVRTMEDADVRVVDQSPDGVEVMLPAITPSNRRRISEVIAERIKLSCDELRGLRNRVWLARISSDQSEFESVLQRSADKWINAVSQLGNQALEEVET
jgi:predicted kinase